jgi:hypothetical protein
MHDSIWNLRNGILKMEDLFFYLDRVIFEYGVTGQYLDLNIVIIQLVDNVDRLADLYRRIKPKGNRFLLRTRETQNSGLKIRNGCLSFGYRYFILFS